MANFTVADFSSVQFSCSAENIDTLENQNIIFSDTVPILKKTM